MKKIVFVIGSMARGGAEKVISILANQYSKRGYQVYIMMLLRNEVGYELSDDINLIDLSTSKSRIRSAFFRIKHLRSNIINIQPSVVISFAARINVLTLMSTLGLNIPVIVSERNDPYMDGRSKLVDILINILYPKSKKVVFQTKRSMSYFNKEIRDRGVIIPNPISISCTSSTTKNKKIVNVGRYTEQKNQALLIKAFNLISKEFPEYKLFLYGEGELRNDLQQLINNLELRDKVQLMGNILNLHDEISDSEFFVLSSEYEGLSNALLEAMMMGIPCISTDCAGADEYIDDGISGLLVKDANDKKLYFAMKKMIENDNMRNQIGINGQKSVQKCRVENIINVWDKYIVEDKK